MKTEISIPDSIFIEAEALAKRLRVSRNKLYTKAIEELLTSYQHKDITAQLNEIYAHEDSRLDPVIEQLQARSIEAEKW